MANGIFDVHDEIRQENAEHEGRMRQVGAETAAPSVRSLDQHTPLPWAVNRPCVEAAVDGKRQVLANCLTLVRWDDAANGFINTIAERDANAALIVRAVNNYAELVKALEFYADSRRYDGPNQSLKEPDQYQPKDLVYFYDVTRDHGRIARTALQNARA